MAAPFYHPISCNRCKKRKVKCSRILPQCHQCRDYGVACVYSERKSRRPAGSSSTGPNNTSSPTIFALHERIRRLEAQCTSLTDQVVTGSRSSEPAETESVASAPAALLSPQTTTPPSGAPSSEAGNGRLSGSGGNSGGNSGAATVAFEDMTLPVLTIGPVPVEDKLRAFPAAVDRVRDLVARSFADVTALTQDSYIPKDMARKWLEICLGSVSEEIFPNLIHADVLRLMPDMLEMPHVHVDAVMVVLYYCCLHLGASRPWNEEAVDRSWMRKLYLSVLRSVRVWQREVSGTAMDMVAAVFIGQVASEQFDLDLSWQFYRLACEYAQASRLHRVDAGDAPVNSFVGRPVSDEDRKNFWGLVQLDLLFRLIDDRPATITADMESWRVNLPWLASGTADDAIPVIHFLVGTRLVFVVAEFFHLLDQPPGTVDDLVAQTEALCTQLEDAYAEWNIDDWSRKLTHNLREPWMTAEVAFFGHVSTLCMLRIAMARVRGPPGHPLPLPDVDADVARRPLAQRVSRRMLATAYHFLKHDAGLGLISLLFICIRLDLPLTYTARNVLEADSAHLPPALRHDACMLDDISRVIGTAAQEDDRLKPLAWAVREVNAEVQAKVGHAGRAASADTNEEHLLASGRPSEDC